MTWAGGKKGGGTVDTVARSQASSLANKLSQVYKVAGDSVSAGSEVFVVMNDSSIVNYANKTAAAITIPAAPTKANMSSAGFSELGGTAIDPKQIDKLIQQNRSAWRADAIIDFTTAEPAKVAGNLGKIYLNSKTGTGSVSTAETFHKDDLYYLAQDLTWSEYQGKESDSLTIGAKDYTFIGGTWIEQVKGSNSEFAKIYKKAGDSVDPGAEVFIVLDSGATVNYKNPTASALTVPTPATDASILAAGFSGIAAKENHLHSILASASTLGSSDTIFKAAGGKLWKNKIANPDIKLQPTDPKWLANWEEVFVDSTGITYTGVVDNAALKANEFSVAEPPANVVVHLTKPAAAKKAWLTVINTGKGIIDVDGVQIIGEGALEFTANAAGDAWVLTSREGAAQTPTVQTYYNSGTFDANSLNTLDGVTIGGSSGVTTSNFPQGLATPAAFIAWYQGSATDGLASLQIFGSPASSRGLWMRSLSGGVWGPWARESANIWAYTPNPATSGETYSVTEGANVIVNDGDELLLNAASSVMSVKVCPVSDWANVPAIKPTPTAASAGWKMVGAQPTAGTQVIEIIPGLFDKTFNIKRVDAPPSVTPGEVTFGTGAPSAIEAPYKVWIDVSQTGWPAYYRAALTDAWPATAAGNTFDNLVSLSKAQVESKTDQTFGLISGERLFEAIDKNKPDLSPYLKTADKADSAALSAGTADKWTDAKALKDHADLPIHAPDPTAIADGMILAVNNKKLAYQAQVTPSQVWFGSGPPDAGDSTHLVHIDTSASLWPLYYRATTTDAWPATASGKVFDALVNLTDAQAQDKASTVNGAISGKLLYDREQALKGAVAHFTDTDANYGVAKPWSAETLKAAVLPKVFRFVSSASLTSAATANPTLAEFNTWKGAQTPAIFDEWIYYTGTTVNTDGATHLWYVDKTGIANPITQKTIPVAAGWLANETVMPGVMRYNVFLDSVRCFMLSPVASGVRKCNASLDLAELGKWFYAGQDYVAGFTASMPVPKGYQIKVNGEIWQATATRTTGLAFDATERGSWDPVTNTLPTATAASGTALTANKAWNMEEIGGTQRTYTMAANQSGVLILRNASGSICTIAAAAGETIGGAASMVSDIPGETIILIKASGSNWRAANIVNSHLKTAVDPGYSANGSIGTAADTVNKFTHFIIKQTAANIAVTLPDYGMASHRRQAYFELTKDSTQSLTISGQAAGSDSVILGPGECAYFTWAGGAWKLPKPALYPPMGNALPPPGSAALFRLVGHATLPDNLYYSTGSSWVKAG